MDGVNTYNCRCPPQWTGTHAVTTWPEWGGDRPPEAAAIGVGTSSGGLGAPSVLTLCVLLGSLGQLL